MEHPAISKEKGHIWHEADKNPIQAEVLEEYWGKPDEVVSLNNGHELWEYRFGLRWNGVGIGFIIGIPLLIPVGHNYMSFTIDQDSRVASVRMVEAGGDEVLCYIGHGWTCKVTREWMCNVVPWCHYSPKEPIPRLFREFQSEKLIHD